MRHAPKMYEEAINMLAFLSGVSVVTVRKFCNGGRVSVTSERLIRESIDHVRHGIDGAFQEARDRVVRQSESWGYPSADVRLEPEVPTPQSAPVNAPTPGV